ncbi:hypothetical protein RFI_30725 [Reticulomyxa filosa]|uniref:Kelch motif family protein n=1 Tax=Reticulomyxa filosa TaxID=46433 RepID=X6LZS3_RETFI|nr:hypothetical protein RFI_30725 [Reticulomyxa filosa]|eukprot:ETO06667.1 hypothetical protein RFI_30725 [Reticulomyxa filosa]
MSNQIFQTLKKLPIPLLDSQCVLHKHELLICGSFKQRACYSYHTLKKGYKLICEYPSDVILDGHCVVKLVDNNNSKDNSQITLLSFGGSSFTKRHTFVMKYVSVWSNISNKSKNHNKWLPFTDNHNHPIVIGEDKDDYIGVRAVIGGSNNHLLFITYRLRDINVFDLNTFQFIKHVILPTRNYIGYHCFVSNSKNGQEQEIIETNEEKKKKISEMLLFCQGTRLLIEYNEDDNTFQCYQLSACKDIASLCRYAYVCINNTILFFGGLNVYDNVVSKSVHKYSIRENKWMTFQNTLPSPLSNCVAILNEDDNYIHIIGGQGDKNRKVLTHMKTKVRVWDPLQLAKDEIKLIIQYWIRKSKIKLGWIDDFDQIIMKYRK